MVVIDVTRLTGDNLIDIQQLDQNAFLIDLHKIERGMVMEDEMQNDQGQ